MRTLNVRLAAILLAVVVVFGGGVFGVHAYMISKNRTIFADEARKAEEDMAAAKKAKDFTGAGKDFQEAMKYWTWYLRLAPDDNKARCDYGMLLAGEALEPRSQSGGLLNMACRVLEDVVREEPSSPEDATRQADARRQLVKMLIVPQMRQASAAQDHLKKLLEQSPNDPELLQWRAIGFLEQGKEKEAVTTLEKAIRCDSDRKYHKGQYEAYSLLARLLHSAHFNQPKEADKWMSKLVENNPKIAEAHRLRGDYLLATHQFEEALKEATQAIAMAPDDAETIVLAARCNLALRKLDPARKLAEHGIQLNPDLPLFYLILSSVIQSAEPNIPVNADVKTRQRLVGEARAKQQEEALKVVRQGVKATKNNPELVFDAASMLIDTGKLDEAQSLLDQLQAGGGAKYRLDYLSGRILVEKHDWLKASERLEKASAAVRTANPALAAQIDLMLGDCYGRLADPDQQLTVLRRARNTDPNNVRTRVALLEATRAHGNYMEALDLFREVGKQGALNPLAAINYAELLRQAVLQDPTHYRWEQVERVLDEAAKALPDNPRIPLLRAQVLADQKRFDEAEKVVREALPKYPKEVNVWMTLAGLAERRGQWAQAEKVVTEARDKNPEQIIFRLGLAALAERRQDWAQAEKILDECESKFHDSASLRLGRMQYYTARYGKDAGNKLRKLREHTESLSKAERLQLLSGLLNYALQINDRPFVDSLSKELEDQLPNDVRIRQTTFERALAAGDLKAAEAALEEYQRVAGQNYYWYYGQAVLLCQRARSDKNPAADLEKALGLLAQARQLRKDWPRLSVAEGEVYRIQGKTDQAIRSYREAWKMGERNALLVETAFQLFFQTRQFGEALQWMGQLEGERAAIPPRLIQLGVAAAGESGQFERAQELLKKYDRVATAKSPRDQFWLGRVLTTFAGQAHYEKREKEAAEFFGDAEGALRRAVELDPASMEYRLTLVQFLLNRGRETQAEAAANAVQDPKYKIPTEYRELVLGSYYRMVTKSAAAEKHFLAALAAAPQNLAVIRAVADFDVSIGKLVAAEQLVQSVHDGKVPGKPEDVAWSNRQLAEIYITRGGYVNFVKAQKFLDENLNSPQKTPGDERGQALLYQQDPDPQKRDKAVAILENLAARKVIQPADRFTLAKIYLNRGDWGKASGHLRALMIENPKDSRYLGGYIGASIEHGDLSNAEIYLDRLDELLPHNIGPVGLRAQLLAAKNRPEEAYKLFMDFLDDPHAQPEDRTQRTYLLFQGLFHLANSLNKPQQKAIAEKCRQKAKELREVCVKGNPALEAQLAAQMVLEGKVDEGLDMLDQCLETSTANDVARACDHILVEAKLGPEPLKHFDLIVLRAVQVFHEHIQLLMVQASLRSIQMRYEDAEERYRKVLDKDPNYYPALNNLAELLALQKIKLDEALQDVNRAIEVRGPEGAIVDTRASVYLAMNRTQDAIRELEKALRDREDPARLFHLAEAYRANQQVEQAKTTFEKAVKKGLTKDSLHPLEAAAFEEMRQFARQP